MHSVLRKKIVLSAIGILFSLFTLLNLFLPSKSNAYALENECVYLGGSPIGIIADGDGLLVTEFVNVTSPEGSFSPALKAGIEKGDVILSVNGESVSDISHLNKLVQNATETLYFKIKREGSILTIPIEPIYDLVMNSRKIGLMVKNNIAGIGTLTFVTQQGRYGALGHKIVDSFGHFELYSHGKIYKCNITGYKNATADIPGELIGKINIESPIGTIESNCFCGIFGSMVDLSAFSQLKSISIGSKNDIKPGKAEIYTTISEEGPKKYEIEIVKTFSQGKPDEKSMVIRITDKKLLSQTHGILQGMSGSPIVQNGKLIGAVTHVFTNDCTMGYGIYIDWMINKE